MLVTNFNAQPGSQEGLRKSAQPLTFTLGGSQYSAYVGEALTVMFHSIRPSVLDRMHFLEQIDSRDREDGTSRLERLRQVPPETGQFLALLAANAPEGVYLEIGTSAGYSTLWIALACELLSRRVTTFEVLPEKAKLARDTFRSAQMEEVVTLVEGDAKLHLSQYKNIAFCFLDAEKEVYGDCYEAIIPKLVKGGLLVADNAINHRETLKPMLDRALVDERVDALIVPIGKGVLVCRKV
jgi:predicted O-methyltransferase YrrM